MKIKKVFKDSQCDDHTVTTAETRNILKQRRTVVTIFDLLCIVEGLQYNYQGTDVAAVFCELPTPRSQCRQTPVGTGLRERGSRQ